MNIPIHHILFLFAISVVSSSAAPLQAERMSDNRLVIRRAGAAKPLLIQHARADFRPYIHPIMAPDGNGVLTEASPAVGKAIVKSDVGYASTEFRIVPEERLIQIFARQQIPYTQDLAKKQFAIIYEGLVSPSSAEAPTTDR